MAAPWLLALLAGLSGGAQGFMQGSEEQRRKKEALQQMMMQLGISGMMGGTPPGQSPLEGSLPTQALPAGLQGMPPSPEDASGQSDFETTTPRSMVSTPGTPGRPMTIKEMQDAITQHQRQEPINRLLERLNIAPKGTETPDEANTLIEAREQNMQNWQLQKPVYLNAIKMNVPIKSDDGKFLPDPVIRDAVSRAMILKPVYQQATKYNIPTSDDQGVLRSESDLLQAIDAKQQEQETTAFGEKKALKQMSLDAATNRQLAHQQFMTEEGQRNRDAAMNRLIASMRKNNSLTPAQVLTAARGLATAELNHPIGKLFSPDPEDLTQQHYQDLSRRLTAQGIQIGNTGDVNLNTSPAVPSMPQGNSSRTRDEQDAIKRGFHKDPVTGKWVK